MVSVAQHNVTIDHVLVTERAWQDGFHGSFGAHRHVDRGPYGSVRELHINYSASTKLLNDIKLEGRGGTSLVCWVFFLLLLGL